MWVRLRDVQPAGLAGASREPRSSSFLSLVVPIGVLAAGVGVAANRQDLVRALAAQRAETDALHAVQQERARIARDVHDFVGRELTLLSVRSQVLARRATGGDFEDEFEELSETARVRTGC